MTLTVRRPRPRGLVRVVWGALLLALIAAPAWAQQTLPPGTPTSIADAAAVLGPIGISPFVALAGLGLADALGLYTMPTGLSPFAHPLAVVFVGLLALGLHVGRSSKLTKPLAETAGLFESLVAVVAACAVALPQLSGTGPKEAGLVDGLLFVSAAASGVLALAVLRTALDVMIWLSPFPFVDAAFQLFKLMVTALLIVAAILAPPVAIVLNGLILVATFFTVRWAVRTLRFGLTIAYDLTLGRLQGGSLVLPRDRVVPSDIGPLRCFALDVPGFSRRAPAHLELRAGRWFLVRDSSDEAGTPLGDAVGAVLTPTWAGLELVVGTGTVLILPRYRRFETELRTVSRAVQGSSARSTALRPSATRARAAAAR